MGFTPRQIDEWSMAEFAACVGGFNRFHGGEDAPTPMSPDRFEELREKFKG